MGEFEEMARAAALQKQAMIEEEKARRERAAREAEAERRANQQALVDHVLPTLREAKKDLDRFGTECSADFNGRPPSYALSLVIGHQNTPAAARRQSGISVVRGDERLSIIVTSESAPQREWQMTPEDFPGRFKEAFQDALNRWHGLPPYR
jgi:hypothetical protein